MAKKEVQRQVLWYRASENFPERHCYNVLIVNTVREINIICQRLYEQLKPIVEEEVIYEGRIPRTMLHCKLISLVSPVSEVDFSKVYDGRVRPSRYLVPRQSLNGWNKFIERVVSGEI